MQITVVTQEILPDSFVVFGAYKTQQSARSAITVYLAMAGNSPRYSFHDFREQTIDLED